jgi:hypothetical protein
LPAVALGIIGNEDHYGGYHCGVDRCDDDDYSIVESPRDASGLTLAASAIDIGQFSRLRALSAWLARECENGAPDTTDIREIIYSPDGVNVTRWDRLHVRDGGDISHLTHTHISFFRDSEFGNKTTVFERFFEGDADMDRDERNELGESWAVLQSIREGAPLATAGNHPGGGFPWIIRELEEIKKAAMEIALFRDDVASLRKEVAERPTTGGTTARELIAAMKAAIEDMLDADDVGGET